MFKFDYYDWDEYFDFVRNLPLKERTKLVNRVITIEHKGLYFSSKQKWTRKMSGYVNLLEIRSNFSSNIIRVLFFKSSNGKYVITNAFKKKSQKTPREEINKALRRRRIYEGKYGNFNE